MVKTTLPLIVAIILLTLLWLIIVPIWHFPDEQSHFGQIAYISITGKNPTGNEASDLTEEILISERLLGTERDKSGNNMFTFHPEYKIPYTDSYYGLYEASISALARTKSKTTFVKQESSRYPVLYYLPASLIYKLFNNSDIFTRVYAVRFYSLGLFLINTYVIYLIGKKLFPISKKLPLILAILCSFQPMFIFANVGVNSDALGNLLFSTFIYLVVKTITDGIKPLTSLISGLLIVLSIYTKPQFIIQIPVFLTLLIFIFFRDYKKKKGKIFIIPVILISIFLIIFIYLSNLGPSDLIRHSLYDLNIPSLFKFSQEYTLSHTYHEVLPWYFGIYDWLGVTYPRIVHRIINITILISLIGYSLRIFNILKKKLWKKRNIQAEFFMLIISLVFFTAISFYDWYSWYKGGYLLGVQGRYFFPLISIHMFIILTGINKLAFIIYRIFSRSGKNLTIPGIPALILSIMMILLNFYGLYTISKTYYDINGINTFITQISQYKPLIFKGPGLIILIITSIAFITIFVYTLFNIHENASETE